jgi:hypothetical protein
VNLSCTIKIERLELITTAQLQSNRTRSGVGESEGEGCRKFVIEL